MKALDFFSKTDSKRKLSVVAELEDVGADERCVTSPRRKTLKWSVCGFLSQGVTFRSGQKQTNKPAVILSGCQTA